METQAKEIIFYTTSAGRQPFVEWQKKLSAKAEAIVLTRIARMRAGNWGDCKSIKNGAGIYELRIDFGPGYRVYFGKQGSSIVVLLTGGDKGSQDRDIAKARQYWLNFKEQENG